MAGEGVESLYLTLIVREEGRVDGGMVDAEQVLETTISDFLKQSFPHSLSCHKLH